MRRLSDILSKISELLGLLKALIMPFEVSIFPQKSIAYLSFIPKLKVILPSINAPPLSLYVS